MKKLQKKQAGLRRRHTRVRGKISGTAERPRLCITRSNANMYAQVIDDVTGKTICALSTLGPDFKKTGKTGATVEGAAELGKLIGKKAQKKQAEQQELLDANKQTVSMLIIDKKRMKLKDAGLPQMVIDQTPKMMRGSKLPIIKAKVGPQIVSLICDEKIFDSVPVKKEVKAVVSGIYVLDVKGLHGKTEAAPEKKKGFFKRLVATAQEKAGAKPVK